MITVLKLWENSNVVDIKMESVISQKVLKYMET